MPNRISIIGTVGLPAQYGGFETLTEYLVQNLNKEFDMVVYCSSKQYQIKNEFYNGARLKYINLKANGVQSILYDIISILKAIRYSDTLLILGVSGCIILPFIKPFYAGKIVLNIDGLEWKRDKWSFFAKSYLKLSESIGVKYSHNIIADNKVIQDYVSENYNKGSVMIPYGADHVFQEKLSPEIINKYPFSTKKYGFKVCRIEPENNVHLIIDAFDKFGKLVLVIVGNWDTSDYGKKLKAKYEKKENIVLLSPIYDQVELNALRSNCYIYIHGHSAGGTNPSLVEAMYLRLPIFSFGAKYNKETTNYSAYYFNNAEELIDLLIQLNEEIRSILSSKMFQIANERYLWKVIAKQYSKLFKI
jgi:glycosyltransferase involved in cell wall biosynthesis